ncbi:LAFA_0B07822g1_1 [Lachancea sp. 'fantastica']|nr:LAFA_0B07822g1_1 [Lachancea sp. 'fantastica']
MAPPTPVFGREELEVVRDRIEEPCQLKSLIQHECEYNGLQYVCLPFKRVFQECIVGKQRQKVRFEVTTELTNGAVDATVEKFWVTAGKESEEKVG